MHNHAIRFTNLFSFLSYVIMRMSINTDAIWLCSYPGNFTANSTFGRNRDLILSTLASQVSVNGGFYNATVGQDPDKVFALALCRGDSSSEGCASCVNSLVQEVTTNCPNKKEAVSWGSLGACLVRYANRSIFGQLYPDDLEDMTYIGCNVKTITSNLTQFHQTWEYLMGHLVKIASMGSSRLKYATGEANLTFYKIYALMQCTPDISQSDCDFCLHRNVAYYESQCNQQRGGAVHSSNCLFRWEFYLFYKAIAPPPPLPLSNATITKDKGGTPPGTVVDVVVSTIVFNIALVAFIYVLLRRRNRRQETGNGHEIDMAESLQFDFSTIRIATNDFSIDNKLGQGGFGAVYKGRLLDGQDIAVKRLNRNSTQGETQFKNEVFLMARLQHRNLVRLLGFCFERNERLLIYEFVSNSSLDNFIFDPINRSLMDWEMCYKIIVGIARGILYLHEDSRVRIVHRDLKASNILLDRDMNPKIADFGTARLFEMDQTQGDTSKIVGTFGYMAPEYVKQGHFSVKSDVFSFGVLILEIISGQKQSCFHFGEEGDNLLSYAWKSWREGTALNLIDPILRNGSSSEMMRCIHIGLLCVQENVANRPTMASIGLMLTSCSTTLSVPTKPGFFMHTISELDNSELTGSDQSNSRSVKYSVNEASITDQEPR
ncbi:hypothetical protein Dsin_023824 [Dipteronia sinensis]|uniref:Uncharacterized protein n=1 Tax=Dipteronia sinensis TaxID=43782 RepID=A0AAE0E1E9_9ROSI|nr:hypothetical protein Dsin_023824 [Dipteronia sinensis]